MIKRTTSMFLFVIFSSCLLAQDHSSLFVTTTHEKLLNAETYTLQVANLMPAEHYTYRPTPEQMSFAEQLIHLASNLKRLSFKISSKPKPPAPLNPFLTDKDSIHAVLEDAYEYAILVMDDYDTASLTDTVDFFAGPKSKLQIINLINDHQTHHRGQLMVYLRLQGLDPPQYIGW